MKEVIVLLEKAARLLQAANFSHQMITDKAAQWDADKTSLLSLIPESVRSAKQKFPVSVISRDDLEEAGIDSRRVDDFHMEVLAKKMGEDYWSQLGSLHLPMIAEIIELPFKNNRVINGHINWNKWGRETQDS